MCIRGTKQDYDDWNMPGWSGDDVFGYMKKAEKFHEKKWFKEDKEAHGYNGMLDIEPHDLVRFSFLKLRMNVDQNLGTNLQHDP